MQEVLDLQPEWTHKKTEAMDRRGIIVRREILSLIRERLHGLTSGSTDVDWEVEGRDGTGPKTEIPWVRVHDAISSPSATVGWYVVYLFSALGDRLYLSIGHGSTEWTGVDFKPRPPDELRRMTHWARGIVRDSLSVDFDEEIALQARRSGLGPAYEAGTVLAKAYPTRSMPGDEILWRDLNSAISALAVLYHRQETDAVVPGRESPEVHALTSQIDEAAGKQRRGRGQGFGLSKPQKDAVEKHAVDMAIRHYRSRGWSIEDVGATRSYDLHGKRDGEDLFIEVKGTTSAGETVVLTANEVKLHESEFPQTALFLVSEVVLTGTKEAPEVTGGKALELSPWSPESSDLQPMAYRYKVPSDISTVSDPGG